MTDLKFSIRVARILLYGHLALFCFGIILAARNDRFDIKDTVHVLLMGFPMLAATALAGVNHILTRRTAVDEGNPVHPEVVRITQAVCFGAIGLSFIVYALPYFDSRLTVDDMKIVIGVVETILGAYLAKIRDHLFPPNVTGNS